MIVYDNRFNVNEWFVLCGVCAGVLTVILLPKRFTLNQSILFFMCGVYSGFLFDHTLSVQPVSYYDVNDISNFQVIDFISYWMYGPMSYLFFYAADFFHIRPSQISILILVWSTIGTGLEWCAVKVGVFHYREGYKLIYSFAIYMIVHSVWGVLFFRYRQRSTS